MLHFEKWKIAVIALVCLLGLVFTIPNFLSEDTRSEIPDWLPNQSINLGLDLRGGSHLLLEVDREAVIDDRMTDIVETIRTDLGDVSPRIRRSGFQRDGRSVAFEIRDPARLDEAVDVVRDTVQTSTGVGGGFAAGFGGGGPGTEVETEGNRIIVRLTDDGVAQRMVQVVQQSIEIVRKRVDELGVAEPTIQQEGLDRIIVQAPGLDDPERLKEILGKTAKMTFHLVDQSADPFGDRVPPGSMRLYEQPDVEGGQARPWIIRKKVEVSGEHLVDAQPTFDQGQPVVSFRFDSVGAKRFGKITSENVGRPFAIVLDDEIISAPRINSPILQGSGIITGGFTAQTANDLAVLLRAGALPAPLTILEERTVGPDLGADSIAAGELAAGLGFLFVVIFMVVSYGPVFGMAANVALVTNLVLIMGTLSSLQATLTLPGIAGIVLTIGMAVDANVLIFERIREELANGRSPINAVEAGYKRAFVTIVDSNVTTLIAAAILFGMGSGPVRGFAVTLGIGIVSSMFTAILLSRMIIATWLRRRRPALLNI
ncbi:MAG: protein-export membrane protein SecD [Rhizobiales bacterium NRL2]|jgi:preprotein translocase subunit SecD|nr:MAG: protein-export membrane protein SecD [Rhizobiales bacterium NRL2]